MNLTAWQTRFSYAVIVSIVTTVFIAPSVSALPQRRVRRQNPPENQPNPSGSCALQLHASPIQTRASCWLDERVSRATGVLNYPCDGSDGPADATFRGSHFTGEVRGGVVHLRLQTQFHFGDGCDWTSTQTIDGPLSTRVFSYHYSESPVPGQRGCAAQCLAEATLRTE